LRQLKFPEPPGLFDYEKLSQAHILELGYVLQTETPSPLPTPISLPPRAEHRAGTGLLALALSPLVRRYTATDIPALVPLLRKNLLSTPSTAAVTVTALDWSLPTLRQIDISADSPDVLLVVDCIYHPTLVRPLLATMSALALPRHTVALALPRHTVALVVAELRAEDVLREFLEGWIVLGWRIWSVADGLLGARWWMWVAWREGQVAADGGT
jgi:protein N-lysine methyltransferase METTL21D